MPLLFFVLIIPGLLAQELSRGTSSSLSYEIVNSYQSVSVKLDLENLPAEGVTVSMHLNDTLSICFSSANIVESNVWFDWDSSAQTFLKYLGFDYFDKDHEVASDDSENHNALDVDMETKSATTIYYFEPKAVGTQDVTFSTWTPVKGTNENGTTFSTFAPGTLTVSVTILP